MDLLPNLPGAYASDFAPGEADYLRWLAAMGEMGANTVRVHTIMDDHFYNALYQYNINRSRPLYLIQGISPSDAASYGSEDSYHEDFLGDLLRQGEMAVDIIHGRRFLTTQQIAEGGRYHRDVSPWTLGYMIGYEWNADIIAYTDHSSIRDGLFAGTYFTTLEEATPFEAMLAQVMDGMVSYETEKYRCQRVIGFSSAPDVDFLEYEDMYARQLGKYAWLDAEHILPTAELKSGYYAAYRLFGFCRDFSDYLSQGQTEALHPLLEQMDTQRAYDGYLELLSRYHTMPVVASCGFSSARGVSTLGERPRTETQQGLNLMAVWQDAVEVGISGLCISAWQDVWGHLSWNTGFAMDGESARFWHDLQSDGQNLGLLAFEPGEEAVCLIDGDPAEWRGNTPVLERDGRSLYVRWDREGLYLMVKGEISRDEPLYLPLDLSGQVGVADSDSPSLSFDRGADFILCLNGTDSSRLLVHERYDAMRMNFSHEQTGKDPFAQIPAADSRTFVPAAMAVDNPALVDTKDDTLSPEMLWQRQAMGSWDTGLLTHGNGDPDAPGYNSVADFCYGGGCVEVRLPWLLLNIADPVRMLVHRDYYDHYGVETESLRELWIGLGDGGDTILMSPVEIGQGELVWRERLKQSYVVVREHWGNAD